MSRSVLVTGATGFLGGYIIREFLANGYRVVAVGRNRARLNELALLGVKPYACDLADLGIVDVAVDLVVHAAALSTIWGPWSDFYRTNVQGTQQVVDFCQRGGVEGLVFISSPSIYAGKGDRFDIIESDYDPTNRLNNYIRSKIMAERVVYAARDAGLRSVVLRPRGIIGVGDSSIVPRLVHANNTIGIPLFRGGENVIDLTCVENVAYVARLAAEYTRSGVFNITNHEPRSLKNLLDQLFSGMGIMPQYKRRNLEAFYALAASFEVAYRGLRIAKEPPLTRYTVCTLGFSQTLSPQAAIDQLGYRPPVRLDEGIERYVAAQR